MNEPVKTNDSRGGNKGDFPALPADAENMVEKQREKQIEEDIMKLHDINKQNNEVAKEASGKLTLHRNLKEATTTRIIPYHLSMLQRSKTTSKRKS